VAVEAFAYRVPIETPLRTSFGIMHDRPAVFVRVVDEDGAEGWGEAWCNWPTVGAEHRARLVADVVAPRIVECRFDGPAAAFDEVQRALEVLVIQTAEVGPIAQALAGIDIALWDLAARKAGRALYQVLSDGRNVAAVPAYASGLNPDQPERLAAERLKDGHRAFKLKIGFSREQDLRNLAALREALGDNVTLMADANQGYDLAFAIEMGNAIEPFRLAWYEEPIRADAPVSAWQELAARSPVRLAAGENLRGEEFEEAIGAGIIGVVQPDIGKWGGVTGTSRVARRAVGAGLMYCPHWLAGGIGLMASLHVLAAAGGGGLLELDANPNPLREMLVGELLAIREGKVAVPQGPGLGIVPDLAALDRYRTWPVGR
jgi:L-alanine-DL-glutamate epimerase-like enolase superfamily enzyme